MSWSRQPRSGSRLPAPEDGIVASLRPRGWLGTRWQRMLKGFPRKSQGRLSRGKGFARGGRVRDLWFAPGLANAEVVDTEHHRVSVRVAVFEDAQWDQVLELLSEDLRLVADLLEGSLPEALVDRLAEQGLDLLPDPTDLGGDCDCGDFILPCAHMAAVHHLIADALDGDPFLLPTLRGRNRDQILTALRARWGDRRALRPPRAPGEEEPPDHDWLSCPGDLPRLGFSPVSAPTPALGLKALGPPPGEGDLERALAPLYEAGAEAAIKLAYGEHEATPTRSKGFRRRARAGHVPHPVEEGMSEEATVPEPGSQELTEALVNLLAERESAKSRELAEELGLESVDVRNELLELEKLGIVYRTGRTRGTRWWLG